MRGGVQGEPCTFVLSIINVLYLPEVGATEQGRKPASSALAETSAHQSPGGREGYRSGAPGDVPDSFVLYGMGRNAPGT